MQRPFVETAWAVCDAGDPHRGCDDGIGQDLVQRDAVESAAFNAIVRGQDAGLRRPSGNYNGKWRSYFA